jgi:hypothetical protein
MKCPSCPIDDAPCLGESIPRLCVLASSRGGDPGRVLAPPNGFALPQPDRPVDLEEVLALIGACPDRGMTLPHPEQPGCGCSEFNGCERGLGEQPGRVILRDCVVCSLAKIVAGRGSLRDVP